MDPQGNATSGLGLEVPPDGDPTPTMFNVLHPEKHRRMPLNDVIQGTDFTLNRGGEKFKLEDIENHLFETLHLQVTALAVPETRLGFDLGLLIENGPSVHREDILRSLHQKYRVLFNKALFLRTPRLPLNESGKRDRAGAARDWRELSDTSQKIYGTP